MTSATAICAVNGISEGVHTTIRAPGRIAVVRRPLSEQPGREQGPLVDDTQLVSRWIAAMEAAFAPGLRLNRPTNNRPGRRLHSRQRRLQICHGKIQVIGIRSGVPLVTIGARIETGENHFATGKIMAAWRNTPVRIIEDMSVEGGRRDDICHGRYHPKQPCCRHNATSIGTAFADGKQAPRPQCHGLSSLIAPAIARCVARRSPCRRAPPEPRPSASCGSSRLPRWSLPVSPRGTFQLHRGHAACFDAHTRRDRAEPFVPRLKRVDAGRHGGISKVPSLAVTATNG